MNLTRKFDCLGGDKADDPQHGNATVLQLGLLQELGRNKVGETEWVKAFVANKPFKILWCT